MPYVNRSPNGTIISLKQQSDDNHTQYLAPTDYEIIAFLTESPETCPENTRSSKETLSESDKDFMRATEDLIHLLIQKNIILFTELPTAVQEKMSGREKLRSNLNEKPPSFLDNSDSI